MANFGISDFVFLGEAAMASLRTTPCILCSKGGITCRWRNISSHFARSPCSALLSCRRFFSFPLAVFLR